MQQEDRERWWDERYVKADPDRLPLDDWVTPRLPAGREAARVLELGAGTGELSNLLASLGSRVVATDIAPTAVRYMERFGESFTALRLDHTQPLPFGDRFFAIVVADLCLHYFDEETTTSILAEIERVLTDDGLLLARVNSSEDVNHGAGEGTEVEPGFYESNGHYKRFFDEAMIRRFFRAWRDVDSRKCVIHRYGPGKVVYDISARVPARE